MNHFGCQTLSQLQDKVLNEPGVFERMMRYFTVQVSEMFRDPSYFRTVREHVVPVLHTYPTFKIWVAGCSHGEEVWSLAILLEEEGLLDRCIIYATDINPDALNTAEKGIYEVDKIVHFSKNYQNSGGKHSLSDYYTVAYGSALFRQDLKRNITFAEHSLSTDHVFSETHFISCRNVLIYFNPDLQNRVVGLFQNSLVNKGFLGLGSRESLRVTNHAQHFEEVVAGERLYRRRY